MYKIISSGSLGNCEIYFGSVAIDMGIPYSSIKPYSNDLQIVLLSHIHGDHFNLATIKKLAFERPSLRFGCGEWLADKLEGIKNVDVLELNQLYDYGAFKITIGQLYHDVKNCFFRLEKDNYKIFRATDTAHLEGITAKDYALYMIESNYDADTIDKSIARIQAAGQFAYQKNSANTHLSEQQCNDFFYENKGNHSKLVRLHESQTR